MIDKATIRVLQSLGAALSTIHQAHKRGASIRLEARRGEVWVITVDAIAIGGRFWSASSTSLTQAIVSAHGHILADVADWDAPERAESRATAP